MRIIGGTYKGRILHPPKGLEVRPTTDLAKESLFNILNNRIDFEDITVLDIFAGTGNISLEFASRGAARVISVEKNHKNASFISAVAVDFGMKNLLVRKMNAFSFLKENRLKFDVIFADPPYDMKETTGIPGLVFSNALLNDEGWLIIEHDKTINFNGHPHFFDERKYGKVHFTFFHPSGHEDQGSSFPISEGTN